MTERDIDAVTGPIEALLLMATEPMSTAELAQALDVPKPVVWDALDRLRAFYDETGRGFELREVGGGWRYYTRPEHHDVIAAWTLEGQHARLSQAALETLAIVAYQQPVSRSRVSAVRGVNVDGVLRTLTTRGLIGEAGTSEETGAMLFGTTSYFLERMGLTSLDELPPIAPYLPEASLLEAELTDQVAPEWKEPTMSEMPSADEVGAWATQEAQEHERPQPSVQMPPEAERLSDPHGESPDDAASVQE